MNKEHTTTLEAVLDEIMMTESQPSHEALVRWTTRYPEHRDALARFFATWAVQEVSLKEEPADEALAGQRMVSQAMNVLYQQKAAHAASAEAKKAPRLCDAITALAMSEEEFEARCNLDELIVAKLDRRLIRLPSIPLRCFERIAAALGWMVDEVRAMLGGEPVPLYSHKARDRPVVKLEDFVEAVQSSTLSAEAKAEWIEAVAAEGGKKETP
jgi:hypothetical protein